MVHIQFTVTRRTVVTPCTEEPGLVASAGYPCLVSSPRLPDCRRVIRYTAQIASNSTERCNNACGPNARSFTVQASERSPPEYESIRSSQAQTPTNAWSILNHIGSRVRMVAACRTIHDSDVPIHAWRFLVPTLALVSCLSCQRRSHVHRWKTILLSHEIEHARVCFKMGL